MPSLFDSFSAFQREGGSWNELPFQGGFHTLGRSQFRDPLFLFGHYYPKVKGTLQKSFSLSRMNSNTGPSLTTKFSADCNASRATAQNSGPRFWLRLCDNTPCVQ